MNTGASCHVTSNLELFTTYEASDFGILKMGNRGWSKISGMGDICIETDLGYHMTLKDVRHVSDLRVNILSASALLTDKVFTSILVMESGSLLMGRWRLLEEVCVVPCTRHIAWCTKMT